jgi:hypothetical protein
MTNLTQDFGGLAEFRIWHIPIKVRALPLEVACSMCKGGRANHELWRTCGAVPPVLRNLLQ